ncbi:MAG: AAA family ATPase [Myxococcota bacterium]
MYIRRVHIEGFRCIDDLTLEFTGPDGAASPFVAIIGPNGTGKTSILEALSACLIRVLDKSSTLDLPHQAAISFAQSSVDVHIRDGNLLAPNGHAAEPFAKRILYIPASRDPQIRGRSIQVGALAHLEGSQALSRDETNARELALHAWLTHLRISGDPTPLWSAVEAFLPHYRFHGLTADLEPQFSNGTKTLPFRALSSGERKIIFLFAEILMHCGPAGILLIDEPEAHLHPDWQRRMPGALQALLPEGQIIAATHSPYIINGLQPHQVFELVADGGDGWS